MVEQGLWNTGGKKKLALSNSSDIMGDFLHWQQTYCVNDQNWEECRIQLPLFYQNMTNITDFPLKDYRGKCSQVTLEVRFWAMNVYTSSEMLAILLLRCWPFFPQNYVSNERGPPRLLPSSMSSKLSRAFHTPLVYRHCVVHVLQPLPPAPGSRRLW